MTRGIPKALPPSEFYSVSEAAAIAGVNHMTIRRALDRGEMKKYQIARKVLIERGDYRRWLESLIVTSAA
jgi:excisionase family DNA binding protein